MVGSVSLVLVLLPLLGSSAPSRAIVCLLLFGLLICLAPSGLVLRVASISCVPLRFPRLILVGLVGLLPGLWAPNFGPVVGRRLAGLGSPPLGSDVSFMVATFTWMSAGLRSLLVLSSVVIVGTPPSGPSVLALPPMLCTVGCSPKAGPLSVPGFGPMILPGSLLTSCLVVLPWSLVGSVLLNIIFALAGVRGVGVSGPILVVTNCGPWISPLSLFGPCPGPPFVPGLCPPVLPIRSLLVPRSLLPVSVFASRALSLSLVWLYLPWFLGPSCVVLPPPALCFASSLFSLARTSGMVCWCWWSYWGLSCSSLALPVPTWNLEGALPLWGGAHLGFFGSFFTIHFFWNLYSPGFSGTHQTFRLVFDALSH